MGVTSNYSFPVPVATDLVKDGWDAINDLGVAVDTAMNTALGTKKAGMVLLNTTSFSGVASQSFNNVFSATYDNYQIVGNYTASSSGSMNVRLRASGTDNSTASSYVRQILDATGASVSGQRATSTSWDMVGTSNTFLNGFFMKLISPFAATATAYVNEAIRPDSGGYLNPSSGTHNQTVSYDGITFIPSVGTITGSISIYGFNK